MSDVPRDAESAGPDPRDSRGLDYPRPARSGERHIVPPRVQTFGMVLFLLTLTMLFGATMLLFIVLRLRAAEQHPLGSLRDAVTNFKLYTSTAIVLAASLTIHAALVNVRRERQGAFLKWLFVSSGLALLFLAVQTPAMIELLRSQPPVPPDALTLAAGGAPVTQLYKLLFVLVLLHALHVVGGVIYFVVVTRRATAGYYDHEYYGGVRNAAMYWHFLDIVWLTMFGMFVLLG